MASLLITLCTCPDQASSEQIARMLIESQLAACVNILPEIKSIYTWKGAIEAAQEHLLIIKSPETNYPAIETAIRDHHPYELPEIIAFPIERALPEYINWIHTGHE